jgi:hypothetical protein
MVDKSSVDVAVVWRGREWVIFGFEDEGIWWRLFSDVWRRTWDVRSKGWRNWGAVI